ncbi:MAG TPA: ABC transporter ATP-binding protein [Dongiaceae bacterium]|nr:ABC transporter ATP-binding protein [Dongiaceae bacterium]
MIQITHVTKEYDLPPGKEGKLVAADNLSLSVPRGEIYGLVGPNGAGKTTTLKMVSGLLVPTAGKITVNGVDVLEEPEQAQQHIGYLSDFFSVYDDLKVFEYVEYFAHAYKMDSAVIPGRVRQVVARLGLESKYDSFVGGLSRGMKQRLGIARAVVHNPPLLILDEPASGLDPKARTELKDLLRAFHQEGKTIFITSHVLQDLQELCTSLAILEKGKLLRHGKIAEVMREAGRSRRVTVRLAEAGFDLLAWFAARTDVAEVRAGETPATSANFVFPGSDLDLATLVRALVTSGAPVCAVEEHTESLEQLFSRLSSGEVM